MPTCGICGAAIGDEGRHSLWHAGLDEIENTAEEALQKAEYASNVLYQRGLD